MYMYTYILSASDTIPGALNGYTHLGDVNSHLARYEKELGEQGERDTLATSMLVIMVRGLFTHLKFPYAQFPCTDLSGISDSIVNVQVVSTCTSFIWCHYFMLLGDQLFDPMWEAVFRLENLGFTVLGVCCDGLAANRRLFSLHQPGSSSPAHKVLNPHAHDGEKPYLYFLSDPPHLIKTARNCLANQKH